jgi:hypothetical protein
MGTFESLENLPFEIKVIIGVGLGFQAIVFLGWFFLVRNEVVGSAKAKKD